MKDGLPSVRLDSPLEKPWPGSYTPRPMLKITALRVGVKGSMGDVPLPVWAGALCVVVFVWMVDWFRDAFSWEGSRRARSPLTLAAALLVVLLLGGVLFN